MNIKLNIKLNILTLWEIKRLLYKLLLLPYSVSIWLLGLLIEWIEVRNGINWNN